MLCRYCVAVLHSYFSYLYCKGAALYWCCICNAVVLYAYCNLTALALMLYGHFGEGLLLVRPWCWAGVGTVVVLRWYWTRTALACMALRLQHPAFSRRAPIWTAAGASAELVHVRLVSGAFGMDVRDIGPLTRRNGAAPQTGPRIQPSGGHMAPSLRPGCGLGAPTPWAAPPVQTSQ